MKNVLTYPLIQNINVIIPVFQKHTVITILSSLGHYILIFWLMHKGLLLNGAVYSLAHYTNTDCFFFDMLLSVELSVANVCTGYMYTVYGCYTMFALLLKAHINLYSSKSGVEWLKVSSSLMTSYNYCNYCTKLTASPVFSRAYKLISLCHFSWPGCRLGCSNEWPTVAE